MGGHCQIAHRPQRQAAGLSAVPMSPSPRAEAADPRRARNAAVAGASLLLGLAVAAVFWLQRGPDAAQQYLAGYLIEVSLSVDNVFVFVLIFQKFRVEPQRQPRLLFLGIAGAIVLRSAFLVAGLGAIRHFAWVLPVFGALVLIAGLRLAAAGGRKAFDPAGSGLIRILTRWVPPSLAALVALEAADLVFALDSLPAVLAVTRDAAIAVASNLMAIVGLRALFSVVSEAMARFRYLGAGLAAVLCFIGAKMLAEPWWRMSTAMSLTGVAVILGAALGASLAFPRASRSRR
jgi:tellurite resistance protein TerC